MLERFHEGLELNGIVIVRDGEPAVVTLSDRLRPPGIGFGVGWIHVYPATIYGDELDEAARVAAHASKALGLRDGIAFPQLLVTDEGVLVIEVAARIPGGQMADLVRHAVGVDLVEVALRQALGEPVPDELALPHFQQPLAIRFLTASPGPLPTGKVVSVGSLDPVLAAPGVVQADTYLEVGRDDPPGAARRRPARLRDRDRRHERAGARARGVGGAPARGGRRVSCAFDLAHYRELLDAAAAGGYRFATFEAEPQPGDLLLRHDVDLSLEAALELARLEHERGARATYFLMTESVFYNLDSAPGRDDAPRAAQPRPRGRPPRGVSARLARRPLRRGGRVAQPRSRVRARAGERLRQRDAAAVVHEGQVPLRLEPALARGLPARGAARRRVRVAAAARRIPRSGSTRAARCGETMHAMLDAKQREWLEHLANDRIDLS